MKFHKIFQDPFSNSSTLNKERVTQRIVIEYSETIKSTSSYSFLNLNPEKKVLIKPGIYEYFLTLLQQTALTKSFMPSSFFAVFASSNLYDNIGLDNSLAYK